MTAVEYFIVDRMSSYVVGGSTPATAAHFTRGELEAIYKGNHRSRDKSGAWRVTPPPELLPLTAAMGKADNAITEVLRGLLGTWSGKAPEAKPREAALSGFDKLEEYTRKPA